MPWFQTNFNVFVRLFRSLWWILVNIWWSVAHLQVSISLSLHQLIHMAVSPKGLKCAHPRYIILTVFAVLNVPWLQYIFEILVGIWTTAPEPFLAVGSAVADCKRKNIWGKFKPRRTQVVTGVFCGVKAIMSGMVLSHFSASSFGGCFWNWFAYCRVVGGLTSKDGTPLTWDLKQLCFFSSCHLPTSKSLYTTYINTHVTYIVYIHIDYIYICIQY